ncbi:MAG: glycolate oxidase subunit GlcF [Ahrensia sp.]|nr:glycolate oxidase subunit GlcF [Ahrensia sp.]
MQTNFTPEQLADPAVAQSEAILRKCVHCGFCTATCPTYVTLGNELDSPRGRIYLIKDMLENGRDADEQIVTHIDRCLSCLACMTTCPSGVNYMHLVDHARAHIEKTYRRPLANRMIRNMLALILPYPGRFRLALRLAKIGRPLAALFDAIKPLAPLGAMLRLAPSKVEAATVHTSPGQFAVEGTRKARVALLTGCAQPALDAGINRATIELLNRLDVEVVLPKGEACCGSLVHHMGREEQALAAARHMVGLWHEEIERDGLDAIIITTSGCGTTVKDYGHMLRNDPEWAERAERVSGIVKDITEFLVERDMPATLRPHNLTVAYHAACSLQHGQRVTTAPKKLLEAAGFTVKQPAESHLCCGSAGTYNILQPEIAGKLRARKVTNIEKTRPDLIAAGNIGCLTQIGSGTDVPILHTVKLLNWAYGGEVPSEIASLVEQNRSRPA